jgi:hypothetical protein
METVFIWVDVSNFRLFLADKPFFGWNDRSTGEHIQIGVTKKMIKQFKDYGEEGITIECE